MRKDLPLVYCSEMPIRCFRLFIFTMLFSASRRFCLWDVFYGCRQTIVKFSTELYQVILCRSKNRNICVGRWRWPSAEPVTSTRIRWSAASSSRTEKSSARAGTSTSAAACRAQRVRALHRGLHGRRPLRHARAVLPLGRTPPCTDAVIEHKIGRVFVGCLDPNPLVAGKGAQILRDAGIEVETGVCEDECRRVNEVFFHYITHKTPFVTLKYAMTLDAKSPRTPATAAGLPARPPAVMCTKRATGCPPSWSHRHRA